MAKRRKKKRSKGRSSSGRNPRSSPGVRWLDKQMAQVERLQQAQAYQEAFELLLRVRERYPRDRNVLARLIDIGGEMKNWRAVITYSEALYPMERGDERALTLNNLMVAYVRFELPALAWQTGSMLLADHPKFEFRQNAQKLTQELEPMLFKGFRQADMLLERFNGDRAKVLAFMVEHDRMRFFAENGQSEETIQSCERLLAEVPSFIGALNNISLAYFMQGELEKAIETTEQVLAQEPNNFHALGNLTRYSFLMGQPQVARTYAMELKSLSNEAPDRWLKQAEALAYLGDDEGVREAYLQAKQHQWLKSPLLLHLAAAAHYRLGDESNAWRLWQEALEVAPSFPMAEASLAERAKAPHERDVGWYWPLEYWFAGNFMGSFKKLLPQTHSNRGVRQAVEKFLKLYPQVPLLVPHILDRGDPPARKMMLSLIEAKATPELLQASLAYGLSQHGPDADRIKALQFLAQFHADVLPADRLVPIWLKGKQQEILLLTFKVYDEPDVTTLDEQTYQIFIEAHEALRVRNLKRAEQLFMQVAKVYPDYPAAYNQLAVIYELQGRHQEARTLIEKTHHRFPDYLFARIALARIYLEQKRIDEARALLNPVLQQTELHVSEFRALAQAEMMFALAIENKESARTWLQMWENSEPDHPDIPNWKARIGGKRKLPKKSKVARRLLREFGL